MLENWFELPVNNSFTIGRYILTVKRVNVRVYYTTLNNLLRLSVLEENDKSFLKRLVYQSPMSCLRTEGTKSEISRPLCNRLSQVISHYKTINCKWSCHGKCLGYSVVLHFERSRRFRRGKIKIISKGFRPFTAEFWKFVSRANERTGENNNNNNNDACDVNDSYHLFDIRQLLFTQCSQHAVTGVI